MSGIGIVSENIGALNNGTRPLFKVPTGYGGITIVSADVVMHAAGTIALNIVNMGAAGTAVSGTIATLGSVVYVSGVPQAFTVVAAQAFVDEAAWVAVEEKNTGTANANTRVDICYLTGY